MYPTRFADRLKERAEAILYQYEKIREDFKEQSDFENNIVVLRIASSYGVLRYLSTLLRCIYMPYYRNGILLLLLFHHRSFPGYLSSVSSNSGGLTSVLLLQSRTCFSPYFSFVSSLFNPCKAP